MEEPFMKSPFPGMDPFIEVCDLWEDFHDDLIAEVKRALAAVLPRGYLARMRKRGYVVLAETEGKDTRSFVPDVSVTAKERQSSVTRERAKAPSAGTTTEDEPLSLRAFIETEYEEKFIDIYELKPARRLVTSIEVLSPSNKKRRSLGWKKYLRKRQALLLGKANLVELDLLRAGERLPMLDPWPPSPYTILVAREEQAPTCRVWRAYFDRPLPTIPIPLSRPDPDISLALQPLVDAVYERSRYDEELDYSQPLTPPLDAEAAAWVKQRLKAVGSSAEPPPSRPPRRRRR
jgi:hypothetical protein